MEPLHPDEVKISALDRFNWESVLELEMHESQREFLPSILHYIAQSKFEPCYPFAVLYQGKTVGFIMYGDFKGTCWVNRIVIDRSWQDKGIGKVALGILMDKLKKQPVCKEIRTSFARNNLSAELLFHSAGFRRIGEEIDNEIVMRHED